jgi:kynurenine formamidase
MLDQGIKVMGIDAVTFDPPVWAMFERKQFWEAHRVMLEREYYHLENMGSFEQLPPFGFKLSLFPVKWVNTTAAPVRAVAILED